MARLPRLALAGHLHLLIQRGHNGQAVFRDADDFASYLAQLDRFARSHGVQLHAFALIEAEVLLAVTPTEDHGISRMMQAVSRLFVPAYNRRYGRRGTLWESRFASTVVDAANHGLACFRLIEQSPLQAGSVANAADYRWSSAGHHVGRATSSLLSDHPLFWALGNTPFEREAKWKECLATPLTPQERNLLTAASLRGWAIGDQRFQAALASSTRRRTSPLQRGRPLKAAAALQSSADVSLIKEEGVRQQKK